MSLLCVVTDTRPCSAVGKQLSPQVEKRVPDGRPPHAQASPRPCRVQPHRIPLSSANPQPSALISQRVPGEQFLQADHSDKCPAEKKCWDCSHFEMGMTSGARSLWWYVRVSLSTCQLPPLGRCPQCSGHDHSAYLPTAWTLRAPSPPGGAWLSCRLQKALTCAAFIPSF